jgi:hypothetical protein
MSGDKCPVCGGDCIKDAGILIPAAEELFLPCNDCICIPLDKRLPPPGLSPSEPCPACGKRFIDDVFSHCHGIMAEEGVIGADTPLGGIGTPLISPGIDLSSPPFLPPGSLVLLTRHADKKTAERLVAEVPEIKGVIRDRGTVPGISGTDLSLSSENELLAGCDVRADIFRTSYGSFAIYKQQSLLHIEFARGAGPKIRSVEKMIEKIVPDVFIDACCGAGTLGISALLAGVPAVVFNDAWYPAAFWSAINLRVNRSLLDKGNIKLLNSPEIEKSKISSTTVKIAELTAKEKAAVVLWGDYKMAGEFIPEGRRLAAIDIFGKNDRKKMDQIVAGWKTAFGGDAFIP